MTNGHWPYCGIQICNALYTFSKKVFFNQDTHFLIFLKIKRYIQLKM